MRIDPSRLSKLLLALNPRTEDSRKTSPGTKNFSSRAESRDIKVLKKRLQSRLKTLSADAENYESVVSTIAIQEILMWEFGQDILDHPEFHRILTSITATILQDKKTAASMKKLIMDLLQ